MIPQATENDIILIMSMVIRCMNAVLHTDSKTHYSRDILHTISINLNIPYTFHTAML